MKKFLLKPLLVFAMAAAVLTSCSDDSDDDNSGTPDAPEGKIVAKVGDKSFEATGSAIIANGAIMIGGANGSEILTLIVNDTKVGAYDAKGVKIGVSPDAEINYTPDSKVFFSSTFAADGEKVGTITITDIDQAKKTISGTFSGYAIKDGVSTEIGSGSFNKVPFTEQAPSSMAAKIDGTDFNATVAVGVTAGGDIALNGQFLNGSKMLVFSFSQDLKAGTYTIADLGEGDVSATYTLGTQTAYWSKSGTFVITKHDATAKRIEGTFNLTLYDIMEEKADVNITNGTFAITYQ